MGLTGFTNSMASKLCKDIDDAGAGDRRPADRWTTGPASGCDTAYLKVRQGGRIVSVAAIIAMAVDTDGRREIIGLCVGPSEAETFWTDFLRSLKSRGLQGVKLVISDAHYRLLKAANARVYEGDLATMPRSLDREQRASPTCAGQHTVVAAANRQPFNQPAGKTAVERWRHDPEEPAPAGPSTPT